MPNVGANAHHTQAFMDYFLPGSALNARKSKSSYGTAYFYIGINVSAKIPSQKGKVLDFLLRLIEIMLYWI
jgi:hypothetical protein